MITPTQIHKKAQKLWTSGRILQAALTKEQLFPWSIAFRKPSAKQQIEDFAAVQQWVSRLKSQSKAITPSNKTNLGGYTIEYKAINHRQLGLQHLPLKISFATREDLLRYLGKSQPFEDLLRMARQTGRRFPLLKDFLIKKPRRFIKYFPVWLKLLSVCDYLIAHPQPHCYLRELEITEIDSKFIEKHTKILTELLDQILAEKLINQQFRPLKQHGFERRYGLKYDPPLVRLRLLDATLYPMPYLSDLSLPFTQLARWSIPCKRVFITENKINGLSFPKMQQAVVIFGLGYGVDQLADIPWLSDCELYYWGDIDTHGFATLSRLRHHFPRVQSIMMDKNTLLKHKKLCSVEPKKAQCSSVLQQLSVEEQQLYQHLQQTHQRLEQERLPMSYIKQYLLSS